MLSYALFRFLVFVFGLMPFWMVYGLSNLLFYLLYYGLGYRKKVVRANLRGAFPDKNESELKTLEVAFYRHLCDVFLEGIKGLSTDPKKIVERYRFVNMEASEAVFQQGKHSVITGSHCGNWEWAAIAAPLQTSFQIVVLFQPIKNKYINKYVVDGREKAHAYFRSARETQQAFDEFLPEKRPHGFIFLADQSPSNIRDAHWLPFLNRDTAVLHGPAKYAQKYDLPVLFIATRKIRRGYYEVHPEVLTERPNDFTPQELTALYFKKVEALILEKPEHWLWSHKRWKHVR